MDAIDHLKSHLRDRPRTWVVTGAAGFIGSHLVEALLALDQEVVGLDNFETGDRERVAALDLEARNGRGRFRFVEGDIRDLPTCRRICEGADYLLHEAALISVAESMSDPQRYEEVNVAGFINVCQAAVDAGVSRVVLASSCAVYGDTHPVVKVESSALEPISPYGLTKHLDELYGALFARSFGLDFVALRYFNVFGPGQKPGGAYGAVIPRWIEAVLDGRPCPIYGDGTVSRDYCEVRDIVQANLLAACVELHPHTPRIFNVGSGVRTSLLDLHQAVQREAQDLLTTPSLHAPLWQKARLGDIHHVGADLSRTRDHLGYRPRFTLEQGLRETLRWRAELTAGVAASSALAAVP